MNKIKERLRRLLAPTVRLAALTIATLGVTSAWAADRTNPVTGETESYTNTFIGETTEWNAADQWDQEVVPFVSGGDYNPALVDAATVSTSTAIDGWTLRVGAYNGASIAWNGGISKIQASSAGCWLTADETSSITIASFAGNQLEGSDSAPFKLSSANAGGITWTAGLTSSSNSTLPFWYYLKGDGTVVYGGDITVANAQVIKQADVSLSGTKEVKSKTLVSFTSTTKTFTADAAIKIKDGDDVIKTVYLTSVTSADDTTLTTDDDVGACELVQTSTGVVLYYVDGDPAEVVVVEKTYKPSISVNFTTGTALSTAADVGIGDYAIPGTSWNNLVGNNGSLTTVTGVDSTGTASTISGAKVTISGTRGYYNRSGLSAATELREGYIDDNNGNPTPTVVVEGIPYYSYKVVIVCSSDNNETKFGYMTVNGTSYKGDLENTTTVVCDGATMDIWGSASDTTWTEGGNYLVTPTLVNTDGKLTIVSHRLSGSRAGLAAIQIVEVKAEIGENDLEIPVSGDTTYTVSEAKELSGTVYLTGSGTLTLDGNAKISAATIEVGPLVTLNVNADRLDATTFTGAGTVVYDGSQPGTTKGFDDSSAWTGTVWVKNVGDTSRGEATDSKVSTCLGSNTTDASSNDLNKWGNSSSFVKFTNVRGYMATANVPWTLILEDDSSNYAWYNNEGWTARTITIAGLKGDGTFWDINDGGCRPFLNFTDASQFTGSIKALGKQVFLNGAGSGNATDLSSGRIIVPADQTLTVAADKTWHTRNGLVVNGTLNVNGALDSESSTSAVSGEGTVVFNGKLPSPTGDAWWKNSAWDGTVQVVSVVDLVGTTSFTGSLFKPNDYGNTDSTLELKNCTGWLPVGEVEGDNVCTVPLKITGTLTINNGYSNKSFVINKLSGNGAIYTTSNLATVTIHVLNADDFTGYVQLNKKRVVFGETIPSTYVDGQIYVGSGFSLTVPNSDVAWYGTGGITVDGELKAVALSNFGGGTTITTTDNGVFTLTSTGNGNESETDTDYTRIKGTGSLKYEGSGWRALSTNNFPTAVTLVNEQAGDILLSRALTYTIGSLAGSKNFQGNYGSGSRYLNIIQSKDTEWSGNVITDSSSRLAGFTIDAASTGTLTYSGTGALAVPLTINGGAVNITGTWKGNTTVAGTIGGTGTITGALNFSAGATFKAYATDDADGLVATSVTYPEEGTVTVDASAIEPEDDVALLKATGLDASKFALTGAPEGATLEVVDSVLTLKLAPATVTITVPVVPNTTVTVKVGDYTILPTSEGANTYEVEPGSTVNVTYAAASGYDISGTTEYAIDTNSATTFDLDESTKTTVHIAARLTKSEGEPETYSAVDAAIMALLALAKTDDAAYVEVLDDTPPYAQSELNVFGIAYNYEDNTYVFAAAKIGSTCYPTLAAAVGAIQESGTVTVARNVTVTDGIELTGDVALDMAGKTITYSPTYTKAEYLPLFKVPAETTLTIDGDGSIVGPANGAVYDSKVIISVFGTLNYLNGTMTATGTGSDGMYGVYVLDDGTAVFGDAQSGTGPTITSHFAAIGTNNTTAPATITVYGGAYTANATPTNNEWWSYFCAPVYAASNGNYTLAGGTFTGYYGVSSRYSNTTQTIALCGATLNASSGTQVFVDTKTGTAQENPVRTITSTSNAVTVPADWKWVATETEGVYELVEDTTTPIEPGTTGTPCDTKADAEALAEKTVVAVPDAVAEKLTEAQQAAYKDLFEPKVVEVKDGETTKYVVSVELTADSVTALQGAVAEPFDGDGTDDLDIGALATNTQEVSVAAKPGLYYGVYTTGSLTTDFTASSCVMATGDTVALTFPKGGTTQFYKAFVSVTPVDVPQE